ncbi:MAG: hypothetical protein FIA92_14400 [Chloroflexi bacterium]|nr:hypothetical protein [Chloroflexota bacterium]
MIGSFTRLVLRYRRVLLIAQTVVLVLLAAILVAVFLADRDQQLCTYSSAPGYGNPWSPDHCRP